MDIARQIAHAQNMNEPVQNELMFTRGQVKALHKKWVQSDQGISFEQFLDTTQPTFGMDNAVTVPWCGMWLCIEKDGYTHS